MKGEIWGMEKKVIFTDKAPRPGGTYSQAIKIGNMVYVAGITPHELNSTRIYAPGDVKAQTALVLGYIQHILEAAGSSMDRIVKVTSFVADSERFAAYEAAYRQFFKQDPPARSTVEIAKFPSFVEGMVVEIECVAYCG